MVQRQTWQPGNQLRSSLFTKNFNEVKKNLEKDLLAGESRMVWGMGWGRILGSLLGGPLGTLGRPPGACKAKSVTRVCFNSVDTCDDDVARDCQPTETNVTTTTSPSSKKDIAGTVRFASRIFDAGHSFLTSKISDQRRRFQALTAFYFDQNRPLSTEKTTGTDLREKTKELPVLLKLLFSLSRSTVVHFSVDQRKVTEEVSPTFVSSSCNVQEVESQIEQSVEPEKPLLLSATVKVPGEASDTDDSLSASKSSVSRDETTQVEDELMRTQLRMELSLTGIRGLDLIAAGKFEEGFKLVTSAAKGGDPESLFNLGVIYERGFGQKHNLARAVKCYEAAAKLNHPPAFYNLAVIYQSGERPDPEKAETMMRRAAELGLQEAVELLQVEKSNDQNPDPCRFCLENGWDVNPEPVSVCRTSVTQERAQDFWTLARAYQFGLSGLPVDKSLALELLKTAARYIEEARQGYLALYAEMHAGDSPSELMNFLGSG